jgi:hypothetical protein
MKAWIIAAVVAGALVLVGLPAVALALGFHGVVETSSSQPSKAHSQGPDAHHPMWQHRHGFGRHFGPGFGRHGFGPRKRPGHLKMHKLTAKQRAALADRLDQRAGQLHKAAACLRETSDPGPCLKRSFSPRPPRG